MIFIKTQYGVTIFELLLVLVIAGLIIALGIQQYGSYQRQAQYNNLSRNVNLIFQSMAGYHQANCHLNKDYNGVPTTEGLLDPSNTVVFPTPPPPPFSQVINIATDLSAPGFFTQKIIASPLVDTSVGAAGFLGYIAQFNLSTLTRQAQEDNGTQAGIPVTIGTVYLWRLQVAVKMLNPTSVNMKNYKNLLAADCISELSGNTVTPCDSSPPADGSFLVWERPPSFALPDSISSTWPSTPRLKQFNVMYTHDTLYEMNTGGFVETPGGQGASYYLCGG